MYLDRIPIWLIGGVLLTAGVIVSSRRIETPAIIAIAEGFVVAGILSLVVDPLLKTKLVKEFSRDIFQHLIGFDQTPEIKQRLKELVVNTKMYRRDFKIQCCFVPIDKGMRIDIRYTYELVNPTHASLEFTQRLRLERAQVPVVESLWMTENEQEVYATPPLVSPGGLLWIATGPPVQIKPTSSGTRYFFAAKYSLAFPAEYYWHLNFGFPTINVALEIDAPKNVSVNTADYPGDTLHSGKQPRFNRLFMPGEHIDFRWTKSKEDEIAANGAQFEAQHPARLL